MQDFIKKYKKHFIILGLIVLLTAAFVPRNLDIKPLSKVFRGYFQGKVPVQNDIVQYNGASREVSEYLVKEDRTILWTNALFCGMPAQSISNPTKPIWIRHLLFPTEPAVWSKIFLYVICAFVMLISFKVRPWLALVGAIGIGFATENFTVIAVGHNTKAIAIAYLPLIIAGVQYLFRKKHLLGLSLLSVGLGLQLYITHPQITYYSAFMVVLFFVFQLVKSIRNKEIKDFMVAAGLGLLGATMALGANSLNLLMLNEYAKESIRGASALTITKDQAKLSEDGQSGLTEDYVFSYSNGWTDIGATFIPNYSGGDSDKVGLYYGLIGSTSGPKYIGATMFLLMILGLVLVKGPLKWWLVSVMLLAIVLSMGNNYFAWFNKFMYDYFPMYNKFRAPSMMMVLVQVSAGLLGILGVEQLLSNVKRKELNFKHLTYAAGTAVGLVLLLAFTGTLFNDFESTPKYDNSGQVVYDSDTRYAQYILQQQGRQPDAQSIASVKSQLVDNRLEEAKSDGSRSLFLMLAVLLVLWLVYKDKIQPKYAILCLGLLVTLDLWTVGKRYLDDKKFEKPTPQQSTFEPYQADLAIQQDKSYYRVLDLTESTLNSNRCAFFHYSVGGYSAAKIRRFQDLWDWYLIDQLGEGKVQDNNILNMLNMKYFIYPNQQQQGGQPLYATSPTALGNAWVLRDVRVVPNADSAILALGTLDTRTSGIVEADQASLISTVTAVDTNATVKLLSYHPEKLEYEYNSATESNVAFSDIYYAKGWHAFIDGEEVDHFRLNYVLRGLKVPAGKHAITFEYDPATYKLGKTLSATFGSLIYLLVALTLFFGIKNEFLTPKKEE
jgi:hypothetical protein